MTTPEQKDEIKPLSDEQLSQIDESLRQTIKEYGFAIMGFQDINGTKPSYLYTVGLCETLGGEVILVGDAEIKSLHPLFNSAIQQAIAAEDDEFQDQYTLGTLLDGETPLDGDFVEVTERPEIDELIKHRVDDFKRVWQLTIADEKGKLPGEEGYNEDWVYDLSTVVDQPKVD